MKIHHPPYHWVTVALVLAALLFTLSQAYGQSTGSSALFEGRPAMAGAQGGLGAQAGPPQGGIGVQGSDAAQRTVAPRRQPTASDVLPATRDQAAGIDVPTAKAQAAAAHPDVKPPAERRGVKPPARDPGIAKDQRSAAKKVKKAAQRTFSRSRHGVSPIDSSNEQATR